MWQFVDVSSWQHPSGAAIDWAKVKAAGYVGVIIKATQGVDYVNPYFAGDVAGAHGAGLLVGAYHFAQPAKNADPQAELSFFLRTAQVHDLELGAWLDWEDSGGRPWYELVDWCQTFLAGLAAQVSPSGLYTDQSVLGATTGAPFGHHLWIADPSGTYEGAAWARQLAPGTVDGVAGQSDIDDLLAGRGINPNGADAPEQPQPAPVPAPAPSPQPEPQPAPGPAPAPTEVDVQVPQVSEANPGPSVVSGAVKAAQAVLAWKFSAGVGAIDGRFGPQTAAAVKGVQQAHGLAVDGIVGPQTWNLLLNG